MNNPFKGNTALHDPEKNLSENESYYRTLIHSLHEDLRVIDCGYNINKQHGFENPCKNAA